jgi:hypothetical protein
VLSVHLFAERVLALPSPLARLVKAVFLGRDVLTVSPLDVGADRVECCHRLAAFEIALIPYYRWSSSYRFVKSVAILHRIIERLWITPIGASRGALLEGNPIIGRGGFRTRANVIY